MDVSEVSAGASEFYSEHCRLVSVIVEEEDLIRSLRDRITDLRIGREVTSWGLGGEYAQRQADIIAENINKHDTPRLNETRRELDENLSASAAHKDRHFRTYIQIGQAEMKAHHASMAQQAE